MFRIQYKLSFYFKEKWFQVISVIKGKSFDSTLSLKQSKIHVNTFPTIKKIFRDLWYNASPQMTSLFRQSLFSQLYVGGHCYVSSERVQHLRIQKQAKKKICVNQSCVQKPR